MSAIVESLMCFLLAFSCFCTCCRVTKCFSCQNHEEDYKIIDDEGSQHIVDMGGDIRISPIRVGEDMVNANIECSICLEKYFLNEELCLLRCGHNYHMTCYQGWYNTKKEETTCPQCRILIKKED